MYKCQIRNVNSQLGEKLNRLTVASRPRVYKHWDEENEEEWFTHGTEIVKEIQVSDSGLKVWEAMTVEQREEFVKTLP